MSEMGDRDRDCDAEFRPIDRPPHRLKWTGERYLPWIEGSQIHYEHLHRYYFARQLATGQDVLDMASGEGYGADILAGEARYVIGIDSHRDSVYHASKKYARENLAFIQGSITSVPLQPKGFDIITCFEAIEHISDHESLLTEIKRLLRPGGVLVLSSPNKSTYSDISNFKNAFHEKELYFEDLFALMCRHFATVRFFGQRVTAASKIHDLSSSYHIYSEFVVQKQSGIFELSQNGSEPPLYFIAVATDNPTSVDFGMLESWLSDANDTLIRGYDKRISDLQAEIRTLQEKERDNQRLLEMARAKDAQISELQSQKLLAQQLEMQVNALENRLRAMELSIAGRLMKRCSLIIESVAPKGTNRRRLYELGIAALHTVLDEGWRSLWWKSKDYLRKQRVVAHPTKRIRWTRARDTTLPSTSRCKCFAVYLSTKGNYFFREIRDIVTSSLALLGFEVIVSDETAAFEQSADWHVVLAPHEFFSLGSGPRLLSELPPNLIVINTEQPSTTWFSSAAQVFGRAHTVWDINYETSQQIKNKGLPCQYLPLGYIPGLFDEVHCLPENSLTKHLEASIRNDSYFNMPLSKRPIDILFAGALTERREVFLAHAARTLSNYTCYLHFSDPTKILITGETTPMDTRTMLGLAQRSKILLNVHQGNDKYFEWHRIVIHGIWQKTLVISEPCGAAPPFKPGRDYIEAPLEEIPALVTHYLSSAEGRREAERIVQQGYNTLIHECRAEQTMRSLVLQLYAPAELARLWSLPDVEHMLLRD